MTKPHDAQRMNETRIAEQITQRKFCTSCQNNQPVEGGATRPMSNGRLRWVCSFCRKRWRNFSGTSQ